MSKKTFEDLVFKPKTAGGNQAVLQFDNLYGVSVINGSGSYSGPTTFELAVLFDGSLCYTTDLTDDVMGYQSVEQITESMIYLQNLKS